MLNMDVSFCNHHWFNFKVPYTILALLKSVDLFQWKNKQTCLIEIE